MLVSPSRRLVEGPGGHASLEPLIMQVLLLLFDAKGGVVTRTELFDQVWGGVMVGDDSLNRAIAKVRRIGADVAPGLFEIETIPRTGYRLVEDIDPPKEASGERPSDPRKVSRRTIVGGALAVAGVGSLGVWSVRSNDDQRFKTFIDGAEQSLDYGSPLPSDNAIKYLQPAVAMRPGNARAQGLLALTQSLAAEFGDPQEAGIAAQRAERAARTALARDPNEVNARLALTLLERSMLDLATNEDRLRAILATAPENTFAMRLLWGLLQTVGRSHDSFALVERAIALRPLAAANNFPMAQLLWILGRTAEADRVIDRAMQLWPAHPWVRNARFSIYAYTGRPRAALAMLDDDTTRPQNFTPAGISAWRVSLAALDQPSPTTIAAARTANLQMVRQIPTLASQAIVVLSALEEVDAAFEIANEFLLFQPRIGSRSQPKSARPPVKSTAWRFTPWLFIPPVAAMRADRRFDVLCDGIGLTEYWRKRGVGPDAFQMRA